MDILSTTYLEHLIRTYGYWALLIGTFLEGETILIIGGFIAHLGHLKLPAVTAIAFIGSFSGDQLYFHVGRWKGGNLLARHPKLHTRVEGVQKIIERHHDLIMLGFRFVYGMRIMTPFVIGMNRNVKTSRFVILNAIGAVIWSVVISSGGYLFGTALEAVMKDIAHYEIAAILGISVIGALIWTFHRCRRKKSSPGGRE